jgi:hypothetical protein
MGMEKSTLTIFYFIIVLHKTKNRIKKLAVVIERAIFVHLFFTTFDLKQLVLNQISKIFSPGHGKSKNKVTDFSIYSSATQNKNNTKMCAPSAARAVLVN